MSAPYYQAPPELQRAVRESLRRAAPPAVPRKTPWRPMAIAASLLLALSVGWNIVQLRSRPAAEDVRRSVIAGHVRSLIGDHLLDVASTDQHTVKPWFAGKLDFAPVVKDLAAQGFPLAGGRVDYLADRRVAALIYYRRLHVITLYQWPSGAVSAEENSRSDDGYNVLHWTGEGMTWWAVSDVSAAELQVFREGLRQGRQAAVTSA